MFFGLTKWVVVILLSHWNHQREDTPKQHQAKPLAIGHFCENNPQAPGDVLLVGSYS